MADQQHVSPFEAIRRETEDGDEYWSARELAKVLGYAKWDKFVHVIEKALAACTNSNQNPADHFLRAGKMVALGSGAEREIIDWHLSRYACYLVVQNGDPEKPIVALGQTYFAVQTRRAELAQELASLPEAQRRLVLRDQVGDDNRSLAATAYGAGVVTGNDFAVFQDHGYMGLYAGERARDIAARKGLKRGQRVLDWMGSEELAANWFRITQTEAKLRREGIADKTEANTAHQQMGAAVRQFIAEQGGTMPEELPTPTESIQQARRREQKLLEAGTAQPALFADEDPPVS